MSGSVSRRSEPSPREARCQRCGESFAIADALSSDLDGKGAELLHPRRRNGDVCGGIGVPFRKYVIRDPNR